MSLVVDTSKIIGLLQKQRGKQAVQRKETDIARVSSRMVVASINLTNGASP
jgi:hypothetical protein